MNYIIAEIQDDDTLKVIDRDVAESDIASKVDFAEYGGKILVAIPCKSITVETTNWGYNTEVTIK